MMLAAQRAKDSAVLEALAASGADVDRRSDQSVTALMVAATTGNAAAVESLVAMSADLEISDLDGFTPLFHAVQSGEENEGALHIADLLINGGSNVNARDVSGATPLMHAALGGMKDMTSRLLDAGAMLNATDSVGWTALHFAARSPSGADAAGLIINIISQSGESVDIPDSGGTTPLIVAAAHNNTAAVRLLLEAGASFSRQDKTGRNAYEYTVIRNAPDAREAIREAIEESDRASQVKK
jgi:ankyrin repeat protein